jgi:hypothetical protein
VQNATARTLCLDEVKPSLFGIGETIRHVDDVIAEAREVREH